MIDNGFCPMLNVGLKWFSAAADGMLVSSPSCGMALCQSPQIIDAVSVVMLKMCFKAVTSFCLRV